MKIFIVIALFLFVNPKVIESDGVDNVKIGMDVSEFLENKSKIYNVKEKKVNFEGDVYLVFNVYENSELIYMVEPDEPDKKVWRIQVYGKKFKTDIGIGVGNTLEDLKEKYTITEISTEEGNLIVFVEGIDVGFSLNTSEIPTEWWDKRNMEDLQNNLKIELIII